MLTSTTTRARMKRLKVSLSLFAMLDDSMLLCAISMQFFESVEPVIAYARRLSSLTQSCL